jgi:glycerophosphoryl diester phosphodiesterase
LLAERLAELIPCRTGEITVFGGPRPVGVIRERLPHLRTIPRARLKTCLKRYIAVGWTGYVPSECSNGMLFVQANVAPWLWGWPNRLIKRMDRAGSRPTESISSVPPSGDHVRSSILPPGAQRFTEVMPLVQPEGPA